MLADPATSNLSKSLSQGLSRNVPQTLSPDDLPSCRRNPQREITLQTDSILWRRQKGLLEQVYCAADAAMEFFMAKEQELLCLKQQRWSATILCTHERRMRELNQRFRGKNTACDSLAFPAQEHDLSRQCGENDTGLSSSSFFQEPTATDSLDRYIGDIALGYQGLQRKVKEYDLDAQAHCAHLTAHAVAHLVGINHDTTESRDLMEAAEETILRKLGFPESNPCSDAHPNTHPNAHPQRLT